jgi:hypothetical protein
MKNIVTPFRIIKIMNGQSKKNHNNNDVYYYNKWYQLF